MRSQPLAGFEFLGQNKRFPLLFLFIFRFYLIFCPNCEMSKSAQAQLFHPTKQKNKELKSRGVLIFRNCVAFILKICWWWLPQLHSVNWFGTDAENKVGRGGGNRTQGGFSKIIYLTVAYEPQSISSQQTRCVPNSLKYLFIEPLGAF